VAGDPPYSSPGMPPATLSTFSNPARIVMVGESCAVYTPGVETGCSWIQQGTVAARHARVGNDPRQNGFANITFIDGHVKACSATKLNGLGSTPAYYTEPWNYSKLPDPYPFDF